jgi:hypothetical protein
MRRTPVRAAACTLTVFGLGLYLGLAFTGSAAAFDSTCVGTACHGSGAHTFGHVCTPGVSQYFVDAFLPSTAQRPRLTAFRVTPAPPCTGATVSGATVDPWPASKVDPGKQPSGVPAGQSVFRIGWTVNVPAGSKPIGPMKMTWSLAWTQPDPTDTTTTEFQPPKVSHDLAVQFVTPRKIVVSSGKTVAVEVVVSNHGPDASGAIPKGDAAALVFHTSTQYPILRTPAGCTRSKTDSSCGLRRLGAHGRQTFVFLVHVDLSQRAAFTFSAKVNLIGCHSEESTCLNNRAYVTITPR